MTVLGRRAWWIPAWLDRVLPTVEAEIEGPSELPEQEDDVELAATSGR